MKSIICRLLLLIACFYMTALQAAEVGLDNLIDKQANVNKQAIRSQEKINNLSDQARKLIDEYKQVVIQSDNYKAYNAHLEKMINSQKVEEASLKKQLNSIDQTAQGIIPLMLKMVDALGIYIELDVPFLLSERRTRFEKIRNMMSQASVSTSEKYRRILEAYQIEMDYGRTLESYTDMLTSGQNKRSVNFIRLGRVIFMYQTHDESEAGIWDAKTKSWKIISDDYKREISKAIRIAKKQIPPDLLILPVKSPEVSR